MDEKKMKGGGKRKEGKIIVEKIIQEYGKERKERDWKREK